MGKRAADAKEDEMLASKRAQRSADIENGDELGDFEDDYEDEYESEDEIFEAGIDGRPDEEREAEERCTWITR